MRMNKAPTADTRTVALDLFKAMAEPVRLRLLSLLTTGEICVCHLHEALQLPQPTVSRHLAYLRQRGWVVGRKDGLWVYYRLAKPGSELHRKLLDCLSACQSGEPFASDRQRLGRRCC